MKHGIIGLILLTTLTVGAQPLELDMSVFATRRAGFMQEMAPDAIALFPCKPVYQRNLDIEYVYRQESNFYYLSGFEEPESVLLFDPAAERNKFVMFVRKRDRRRETYDGLRAGLEGAIDTFKADTAYYVNDLEKVLRKLLARNRTVYYSFGINPLYDELVTNMLVQKRSRGNWAITDPAPLLNDMRLIKNEGDWRMGFRRSIEISSDAFVAAIQAIAPGKYEYEIQAVFEFVYRKNGSPRNGYPCIVGSGPNSTILHYNTNNRKMQDGDMVLMDCGAEYGYYSSDITRSVPVNGKFNREQKDIYRVVLQAQEAAIAMIKPGLAKEELNFKINDILGRGLLELGFIRDAADFRIFSLHGYAHWLGLETHDVGGYTRNGKSIILEPGMVFTVEPGIYVREDAFDKMREIGYSEEEVRKIRQKVEPYLNIGVRLEDDILVTATGYKNLTEAVPKTIDDVEKLMAGERTATPAATN